MSETARPETSFVDLAIQEKIFPRVMNSLTCGDLSDKERLYLGYLVGICGVKGATFRKRETLGTELSKRDWTITRIEKSLVSKGRLVIFSYGGREWRSPYPADVQRFLSAQSPPEPVREPSEQSCQTTFDNSVEELPTAESPQPASEATQQTEEPSPKSLYKPKRLINPVQEQVTNKQVNQPHTTMPVDNSYDFFSKPNNQTSANPYKKDRRLVQHMVSEICNTLHIHSSWHWIAKIVWNISETAECHLYDACSWVKEEIACNRCHSPAGLLTWKLKQDGVIT
jgi:hypothetical protein